MYCGQDLASQCDTLNGSCRGTPTGLGAKCYLPKFLPIYSNIKQPSLWTACSVGNRQKIFYYIVSAIQLVSLQQQFD